MNTPIAVTLGLVAAAVGAPPLAAQSYQTVSLSRWMQAEDTLRVNVRFVAGRFFLRPDSSGALYRAELVYDDDHFDPVTEYDPSERSLRIGVSGEGVSTRLKYLKNTKQRLSLAVGVGVPARLAIEFGAADADLELGGLVLARATLKTGASRTVVRFSEPNRTSCEHLRFEVGAAEFTVEKLGNARCEQISISGGAGGLSVDFGGSWDPNVATETSVDIGFGAVTLRFPKDLGVSIDLDRFLATFQRAGFTKQGARYVSTNYDSARTQVHVRIDAVIGDINVEWY